MSINVWLVALLILSGCGTVAFAGWGSFWLAGRLFKRNEFTRENAVQLLKLDRPDHWNAIREADSDWIPDLRKVSLPGRILKGANLRKALLGGSDFTNSVLDDADLSGASLAGSKLTGASFRGAVLDNADLSTANLNNVDLTDASLVGATLAGTVIESDYPAKPQAPAEEGGSSD